MRIVWYLTLIALIAIGESTRADHAPLPEGVTPVAATWLWGQHSIPDTITRDGSPYWYAYPHADPNLIVNPPWTEVAATHVRTDTKAPAVVYLHGRSGMIRGDVDYRLIVLQEGFAVFEPDAYARPGHSYDNSTLKKRIEELAYAIDQIRELPWVDQDRIVLMGFSEGGRAVKSWSEPGFATRIILTSPRGGPDGVPVLVLDGDRKGYTNLKAVLQLYK
jgi:acetyl esterase/lipase